MDDEAAAIEAVRRFVWSGFYEPDEIVEMVEETIFESGEADQDWLRTQIEQEFTRKKIEEQTWPSITDCDRLDGMFKSLEEQGILALQNAGNTLSDGLSDVAQFYYETGGEQSGILGYCFYHGQDLERVMESGELGLAFGDIRGDDDKGVEIGRRMQRAFEAAGFIVAWDGSIKTRLRIRGINWRRRGVA